MASNLVRTTNIYVKIPMRIDDKDKRTWQELINDKVQENLLVDITCPIYSTSVENLDDGTKKCCCGRLIRSHSFNGEAQPQFANCSEFDDMTMGYFSEQKPLRVYGRLGIIGDDARFIRCYSGLENICETLSELIMKDVSTQPDLLVSCFGGAKNFAMTDELEKEFMDGISRVAVTKGVWLLTTGLNEGVSKLIGQSVHRFTLLNKNLSKATIIGLASWGTLTEHTRNVLRYQTVRDIDKMDFGPTNQEDSLKSLNWNEYNTLEKHHSHFLLLDDGRMDTYLDDRPRSHFVTATCSQSNCRSITIIIEGGFNTLEVIRNDLQNKRSVVIIHGSGRLANVLGELLEASSTNNTLEDADIEQRIALFFSERERKFDDDRRRRIIASIKEVLRIEHRIYLNIFKLERDTSLTDTIIKALEKVKSNPIQQKNFLRFAVSWNYVHTAQNMPEQSEDDGTLYPNLFLQALQENRPVFVDYFLRRYYNPLTTTKYIEFMRAGQNTDTRIKSSSSSTEPGKVTKDNLRVACALSLIIEKLYGSLGASFNYRNAPETLKELERNHVDLIGPYVKSFYFQRSVSEQLRLEVEHWFRGGGAAERSVNTWATPHPEALCRRYRVEKPFDKQEMLRELFLWSVYAGYSDIAFVLLLQLEARISAALIAACVARRLSLLASNLDLRRTFDQQTKDYEEYARACVTACYRHNERLACQLLVRENVLFGDATCMQIAIASHNVSFINTDCFDTVLSKGWRYRLACDVDESPNVLIRFLVSLLTLGLIAPYLMQFSEAETNHEKERDQQSEKDDAADQGDRRWKGIEVEMVESPSYWRKLFYFHSAPLVKSTYDFVLYIWFLLVFSYVLLFDMKHNEELFHWSKVYLFVTVSAMLLEDSRQFFVDHYTQMVEKHEKSRSWVAPFRTVAYVLFYIGLVIHLRASHNPSLFKVARIILAVDLELWYLFSLRFVSAIRILGPKLFMIRNMVRDLMGFIYIIFVCMITYGVVSRALTFNNTLDFTFRSVFTVVIYQPYWFLYSMVDDEKKKLDGIISNATTAEEVSETIVNLSLLVFHMLIINILMLNLLIAVFNFSINDVQEKNEFFWRYQRYKVICEYFQKPIFAYPPLSLVAYIGWLINVWIFRGTTIRVFKYFSNEPAMHNLWTEFENAATYEHARSFVEEHYRSKDKTIFSTLQEQIDSLKDENERIRAHLASSN